MYSLQTRLMFLGARPSQLLSSASFAMSRAAPEQSMPANRTCRHVNALAHCGATLRIVVLLGSEKPEFGSSLDVSASLAMSSAASEQSMPANRTRGHGGAPDVSNAAFHKGQG